MKTTDKKRERFLKQRNSILAKSENKEIYNATINAYTIAKELAKARKASKLTQEQLAEKLDTTQSEVSRIESGCNITVDMVGKYAAACNRKVQLRLVKA